MSGPADASDELSPSDRLMWRIERDPVLRSSITTVGLLDREPDDEAMHRTLSRAVEAVPRLRQRIVGRGIGGMRPEWSDDEGFALDHHVWRVRAPGRADLRSVLDLAARDVSAMFDPARPPWSCTVVDGLEGGKAAFVLRYHHTIADGVGSIDLASSVFDRDRDGSPLPVLAPASSGARGAHGGPGAWAGDAVRNGWGMIRDPWGAVTGAAGTARSIARLLTPAPSACSPLLVGRGINRWLSVTERPLEALHDAAGALGGTVNDVFLSAVAGALASYHSDLGQPVPALRFTMPINLRAEDDPRGGNHFTPVRFTMRIDEADVGARVRRANATVRRWRAEPAVGLTPVLAMVLDQLPPVAASALLGSMFKGCDVDAVDVPGVTEPAFIGGAAIERMWGFGPPTGAALSVTLLSHLGTACIGILADTLAVHEPQRLADALEGALDDVERAAAPTA